MHNIQCSRTMPENVKSEDISKHCDLIEFNLIEFKLAQMSS
jgi:hypothetical protein